MFGGVTCMGTATTWLCGIRLARCLLSGQRGFATKFSDEDAKIYEKQLKRYKRRSAKQQLDRMLKNNHRGVEVCLPLHIKVTPAPPRTGFQRHRLQRTHGP